MSQEPLRYNFWRTASVPRYIQNPVVLEQLTIGLRLPASGSAAQYQPSLRLWPDVLPSVLRARAGREGTAYMHLPSRWPRDWLCLCRTDTPLVPASIHLYVFCHKTCHPRNSWAEVAPLEKCHSARIQERRISWSMTRALRSLTSLHVEEVLFGYKRGRRSSSEVLAACSFLARHCDYTYVAPGPAWCPSCSDSDQEARMQALVTPYR